MARFVLILLRTRVCKRFFPRPSLDVPRDRTPTIIYCPYSCVLPRERSNFSSLGTIRTADRTWSRLHLSTSAAWLARVSSGSLRFSINYDTRILWEEQSKAGQPWPGKKKTRSRFVSCTVSNLSDSAKSHRAKTVFNSATVFESLCSDERKEFLFLKKICSYKID